MFVVRISGKVLEGYIIVDPDHDVVWAKGAQDSGGWKVPALAAGIRAIANEFGDQHTGHHLLASSGEVVRVGDLKLVGEVTPTHTNIPMTAAADVAAALERKLRGSETESYKIEIYDVY